MRMPTPPLETIEDFLAEKRIAMMGASRDPKDFSAALFEQLQKRGYESIPVNPKGGAVMGERRFAHIQDVQPPVDTVLIMTPAEVTDTVVSDFVHAAIRRIWMSCGRQGSVSPSAVKFCQEPGIQVVRGRCPFQFLPGAGAVHRLHGFVRKNTGLYPQAQSCSMVGLVREQRVKPEGGGFVTSSKRRLPHFWLVLPEWGF